MGDFSESDAYASLLRFSHLSWVFQAGAHFSALDGQQLLVVEGSAWRFVIFCIRRCSLYTSRR